MKSRFLQKKRWWCNLRVYPLTGFSFSEKAQDRVCLLYDCVYLLMNDTVVTVVLLVSHQRKNIIDLYWLRIKAEEKCVLVCHIHTVDWHTHTHNAGGASSVTSLLDFLYRKYIFKYIYVIISPIFFPFCPPPPSCSFLLFPSLSSSSSCCSFSEKCRLSFYSSCCTQVLPITVCVCARAWAWEWERKRECARVCNAILWPQSIF